jgi:hypothetical protein
MGSRMGILSLGWMAVPALWAGYGETVTVDARAIKTLDPGWVIIREQWSEPRIHSPHWLTRRELTLRDLNGAPWGMTEEVTATSPVPEGWEVVAERSDQGMDGMHFATRYLIRKLQQEPAR